MPSYRWSCLIAALCGVGGASWGTAASAFQYPPLSDDLNTRFIHRPDAWVGGGMQSPANQPASVTNNSLFGGNGQSPFGQNPAGQDPSGQTSFGTPPQTTGATRMRPKVSWVLETAQQPYVGLLGQIARPGVYEIERRGTALGDLLQDIGGLAKDASGQFRVIRNGRPGQTTSYSRAAQFELMAGDLIIADAQPSQLGQRATNAKPSSEDAVQIGFVNLADRPVVLKLRNEHATVYEILATMGQDQSLASQIKIVSPASQHFQGQPRHDAKLVSETVLIFPQNSVKKSVALESLPEPFKLKREADASAQPHDAVQPYAPRDKLSPDVTESPEVAEAPPPPVEGSTPSPRDVPPIDVAHDNAPAPELNDPTPFDDDSRAAEPSLLNAKGKTRSIHLAKDEESNDAILTTADLDEAEAAADKADSSWSIWSPILTAGVGLLTLIGFSLSLRRRTQTTAQASQVATTQPQPTSSAARNPQSVTRRELLDEIIDDRLPLTEERVPLASPMQFHGRPQPPKTIRLDQRHALPRPHSPSTVGVRGPRSEVRSQTQEAIELEAIPAPRAAATATQKFRIDRTGATGTESKIVSLTAKTASQQPTSGPLDRALSAVQKQSLQKREERGT